jgi:hypothetical protein
MNLKKIYEQRKLILEGIKNTIFKKEVIEKIAAERMEICKTNECGSFDETGDGCEVSGTQPCCSNHTGGCGCSLKLATRALSKDCPKKFWEAVLEEGEQDQLYNEIGYDPEQ